MTMNIEFDKIRMRSLLAIPTIGAVIVYTGITDPVTVLGALGMVVACVKLDQDAEAQE
jgi:hypothetical protein